MPGAKSKEEGADDLTSKLKIFISHAWDDKVNYNQFGQIYELLGKNYELVIGKGRRIAHRHRRSMLSTHRSPTCDESTGKAQFLRCMAMNVSRRWLCSGALAFIQSER